MADQMSFKRRPGCADRLLKIDLNLAFTMLETARIEAILDPIAVRAIIERVQTAVQTVRSFTGRIQDRTTWTQIHSRRDDLEASVADFLKDTQNNDLG
jgi:hypothetical protein